MQRISAVFDRTLSALVYVACVLFAIAWLSVTLEVVLRYFAGLPQIWVQEVAEYTLVYVTFLGAAWLLRKEGHVRIDIVANSLSPRNQAFLNVIISILGAIMCLVLTCFGIGSTWNALQTGTGSFTALQPPVWPFMAVIPVGSFLLFTQFLRRTYGYLKAEEQRIRQDMRGIL